MLYQAVITFYGFLSAKDFLNELQAFIIIHMWGTDWSITLKVTNSVGIFQFMVVVFKSIQDYPPCIVLCLTYGVFPKITPGTCAYSLSDL